ncbi:MAG TPA: cation:proton antiporter, partial [Burkholderiales bacterium]|nr:cation:proton antiporter [Burkholderiales bacterium]
LHLPPLVAVLAAAVIAPLLGQLTARIGLPVVVLEILLGVAIGPQGLGWSDPAGGAVPQLAIFGMAFLFFMAGLEIDLVEIRGQLALATAAWLAGFAVAIGAALAMRAAGLAEPWLLIAIAISTTALGVLVPVLRDGGVLEKPLGRYVLAAGALGEIGPILVMSVTLSTRHTALVQTAFTAVFLLAVAVVGWAVIASRTPAVLQVLRRTMTQSSQLPIRLAVLFLIGLAVMAEAFAVDIALGALAAGLILGLATRAVDAHILHHKLDAVGFGFLVPIFFVTSGMKLDVASLAAGSSGLALAAAFFAAVLLARLPLVLMHLRDLGGRGSLARGLFSATTLSLVVALTDIAVKRDLMTPADAAPLVAAGMLTVILFPALGLRLGR